MERIINTKNFICLTIISMPLYLIRFEIFSMPTNTLETLIGLTFIVWLFELGRNEIKQDKTKKINFQILLSMVLILSGLLISTLVNDNYRAGFGIIKGWFILPVVFGALIYNTSKIKSDSINVLGCLFLSSFLVAIISLIYYLLGDLTFDGRLQAFYLSPNHLAMFLAPGLLIGLLSLLQSNANAKIKLLTIVGISVIALSLYLTYSYSTWIAVIFTYFISILIASRYKLLSIDYKKILLVSFLLLVFLFFIQKGNPKFQDLVNLDERSSLSSRVMIWKASLKILSDNWLFGIGPGNFQEKYLEYQKYFPQYLEWAVPQPHNFYLAFWLQAGLFGISGIIWLVYVWIKIQFSTLRYNTKKQLTLMLLTVIIYFFIHGIVDTTYWKNDLALIFWTILFLGLTHTLSSFPASSSK